MKSGNNGILKYLYNIIEPCNLSPSLYQLSHHMYIARQNLMFLRYTYVRHLFLLLISLFQSLQAVSMSIGSGHPLHQNLETILQKVPPELQERMNRRQLPDDTPTEAPSDKALVRLHKQVIADFIRGFHILHS